jgi:hypothetical protein
VYNDKAILIVPVVLQMAALHLYASMVVQLLFLVCQ